VSWILFGFGLVCALAGATSIAPPRWPGFATLIAWPIGWLTSELPLHMLAFELGVAALLVGLGGLATWPGWVGLACLGAATMVLRQHLILAARTTAIVERGLRDGLGRDYHDAIADELRSAYDPTTLWRTIAMPWPRRPRSVERVVDLAYADGNAKFHLDLYRSGDRAAFPGPRPVFLYVHGGGWVTGSKSQQGRVTVHELAAAGWVCASMNYRLSPGATFPDHLIDVKRAIAWLRANVAQHGGEPRFIVIGGGSAGGHLATLAALTANQPELQPGFVDADTSLQGCVSYYGVYDFADRDGAFGHRAFRELLLARVVMKAHHERERDAYDRASPIHHVASATAAPPLLVIHGDRDSLVPVASARAFVATARKAGVGVAYLELPGAHHAFELFSSLRSVVVVHGVHRFCQAIYSRWKGARAEHDAPR